MTMETLESSRLCRLCGKYTPESAIDIFDRKENHLQKINRLLPILVHEMDFLPKYMCVFCSYKLTEFNNFYNDCLQADHELKSQLSWMQPGNNESIEKREIIPMVQITNYRVKDERYSNINDKEVDSYDVDNTLPLTYQLDYSINLNAKKCEISSKAGNVDSVKRNLFSSDPSNHFNTYAETSKSGLFFSGNNLSKRLADNSVIGRTRSTKRIKVQRKPRKKSTATSKIVKANDLKLLSDVKVTLEKLNIEKAKLNGKPCNKAFKSRNCIESPHKWRLFRRRSVNR